MKYQPDHNIVESFRLWFNDHLIRNGEAFTNISGTLFKADEPQMQSSDGTLYNAWVAPDSQWVYDASISGVTVPSGVTIDGIFETNIRISTDEGKVWIPSEYSPATVGAYYSSKDFEVRVSNQNEENILFGEYPGDRFGSTTTGIVPDQVGFPYVYLKYNAGRSQGLGFGGLQITRPQIRAICVADNSYLFDGITSLFRDTSETYFAVMTPAVFPFDEFGSMAQPFNYRQTVSQNKNNLFYIKEVAFSPFTEEVNDRIAKNAIGGFLDFKLESISYPHARFV